jgi:elongation factor P
MQFLYREGAELIFMDLTTYEQLHIPAASLEGKDGFLKESQMVQVLLYNGQPLDLELPASLILSVVNTDPGAKGDTVSNVTKPATLETGLILQVPIFINTGDSVRVDTRSGSYLGRE